jgi:hypothetical protein
MLGSLAAALQNQMQDVILNDQLTGAVLGYSLAMDSAWWCTVSGIQTAAHLPPDGHALHTHLIAPPGRMLTAWLHAHVSHASST